MTELKADVLVLGAGMVGVSAALHLQQRGRDVVLIDRHGIAGEETSYGNAGMVQCASIFPYSFPRDFGQLLKYALNRSPEAHYHLNALPGYLPWMISYFRHSSPAGALRSAMGILPLITNSLREHEALVAEADVPHLLRRSGWIKLYRTEAALAKASAELARDKTYGVEGDMLDAAALALKEPNLSADFVGAMHVSGTGFVPDPGGLAKAYAALFVRKGGRFLAADARTLAQSGDRWRVTGPDGAISARDVVLAMGPWADQIFGPLGYDLPLKPKRGYHLHLAPRGNAVLHHPVLDAERGYVLAPMNRGIRLTTGLEFARRDAPPTPVQIDRTLPSARAIFPLGEPVEARPWMGSRPCLPDMLPVIGKAPRHAGLWFDFGHQHYGFTLGPVTGRLIAEIVTGAVPFTDPAPYAAERFG